MKICMQAIYHLVNTFIWTEYITLLMSGTSDNKKNFLYAALSPKKIG